MSSARLARWLNRRWVRILVPTSVGLALFVLGVVYLNLTGLGCYHRNDVPVWYEALDEARRWDEQARFWTAVAQACAKSPSVFCYDLMNEPLVPGGKKTEKDWLTGELGGKHFVQRIALDANGRQPREIAKSWVELLVAAIRRRSPA